MEDPKKFDIQSFKILEGFVIEIQFCDGKIQTIDFSKIEDPYWKDLKNLEYFNQVQLSKIDHLEWPHGQDFKPEHLYYWEKFQKYY